MINSLILMKKAKCSIFELVTPLKIDFVTKKKIKPFLFYKFKLDSENIIRFVLR